MYTVKFACRVLNTYTEILPSDPAPTLFTVARSLPTTPVCSPVPSYLEGRVTINNTGAINTANIQGSVDSNGTGRINWLVSQNDGNLNWYLPLLPAVALPYTLMANAQHVCDLTTVNSQIYVTIILKYPSGMMVTMKFNGSNPSGTVFIVAVSVNAYPTLPDIKDYTYTSPVATQLQLNETAPGIVIGVGVMFGVIQVNVALTYSSMYSNTGRIPKSFNTSFAQLTLLNYTTARFITTGIPSEQSANIFTSVSSTRVQSSSEQATSTNYPIISTRIFNGSRYSTPSTVPWSSRYIASNIGSLVPSAASLSAVSSILPTPNMAYPGLFLLNTTPIVLHFTVFFVTYSVLLLFQWS